MAVAENFLHYANSPVDSILSAGDWGCAATIVGSC